MRLLAQKKFLKLRTSSKWESLDALVDVYKGSFGIPYVSDFYFRYVLLNFYKNACEIITNFLVHVDVAHPIGEISEDL